MLNRRRIRPYNIRTLEQSKLRLWKLHKLNPDETSIRSKYNKSKAEYRIAVKRHESDLEEKVLNSGNQTAFYNHVNRRLKNHSEIGLLKDSNNHDVIHDKYKAELFNKFFASVCTLDKDPGPALSNFPELLNIEPLTTVNITEDDILNTIKCIKFKSKYSQGPDGYPNLLLQELKHELLIPLSLMFNTFISINSMPSTWKQAIVTPKYKSGTKSEVNNYRPISQTSIFCKLLERILVKRISNYLLNNNLISGNQHGFIQKRSTLTNLVPTEHVTSTTKYTTPLYTSTSAKRLILYLTRNSSTKYIHTASVAIY